MLATEHVRVFLGVGEGGAGEVRGAGREKESYKAFKLVSFEAKVTPLG